jgi:VanZ family protein
VEVKNPHRPLLDAFLWFLVVVMAVFVVWTSVKPPSGEPFPISDKVLHYLAYTGLTFSMLLAAVWAPVRGAGRFPTASILITLLAFFFGVAIEIVQGPLPGRDAELLDALANAGGALTALALWTAMRVSLMPTGRS